MIVKMLTHIHMVVCTVGVVGTFVKEKKLELKRIN
jgi:roadblock/LC7 domain-containing protein